MSEEQGESKKEKYNAIVYTLMQGKDYLGREIVRLIDGRNPQLAKQVPSMEVSQLQRLFIDMVGLDETIGADNMYNPRSSGRPLFEYQKLIDSLRQQRGLKLSEQYDSLNTDADRQLFYKGLSGLEADDFTTAVNKKEKNISMDM